MSKEVLAVRKIVNNIIDKEEMEKKDLEIVFETDTRDFINYLIANLHYVLIEKATTEKEKDILIDNIISNTKKNNELVSKEIKNSSTFIEMDEIGQIETIGIFYKQILEKKEIDKEILKTIYFMDRETLLCFISACMPMEFTSSKDNKDDIKNLNIISDTKKYIKVIY